ncbi:MAG: PASTA domain-containing protein [Deltaproteobacteria bacterium]|nr:PASTA domain-containing protein [Deltaproteobacteria bacterium]NCP02634.1 PASTA domain-containing protein [Deltaproteobacteria bacterium]
MPPSAQSLRLRIRLVAGLFIGLFLVVAGRAGYLQVVLAEDLQARAEQQQQRVVKLSAQRGTIYDRNGEELALSLELKSLYADPGQIENPTALAAALAPLVEMSEKDLQRKLSEKKNFVWVARLLPPEQAKKIAALKRAGLNFVREHKRYYPRGQIGAQVVGFTGLDPRGLEGLELFYDADLQGAPGLLISARDARGRGMATAEQSVRGGEAGASLYLTIDRTLQYIAEKYLAQQVKSSQAVGGTVVMLDPKSGRVLAMASVPNYNPNAIERYQPTDWRNRAVTDAFEPGSTFKAFVVAAALEEGLVNEKTRIDCERGRFDVGGKVIRDHGKKHGLLSVSDIVKFSSNIGAAKLGKRLEREKLYQYIRAFGFGAQTDIDLPGESAGILRPADRWFEIDLANISFGQGIGVTSLQLATAMAAIANNGQLMKPYVVEKIVDGQGSVFSQAHPQVVRQVISEKTARRVRRMLTQVTEAGGTGTGAAIQGYRVAGKTGTAQKADLVTGGYSIDKRTASFIGMVPAEDPAIVVLVTIDEPQDVTYGGLVAAPAFSKIAEESLRYLDVAPTLSLARQALPVEKVSSAIKRGRVAATRDQAAGENQRMPNFQGMSYREVLQQMQRTGLNVRLSGSGQVVEQSPRAGEKITYGTEVWVRLGA